MTDRSEQPGVIVQTDDHEITRHPTAQKFSVQDGHLFVQSFDADIAIYAPGAWRRARHGTSATWDAASAH